MSLPLVESFYSFQGEGRFAGTPSIFVRLGGCNLNCKGFGVRYEGAIGCDSVRAVDEEKFGDRWERVESLIPTIENYLENLAFKPHIVITGGEPLIHYQNPILLDALAHYIERGFTITIETNATIEIDFERFPIYREVVFSMSVKLNNSGETYAKRVNPKAIASIALSTKRSFFKFVVSKRSDEEEIREIASLAPNIPVYCMPMGATSRELCKHDRATAKICIKNGYLFCDRLHIRLWDNEEGR